VFNEYYAKLYHYFLKKTRSPEMAQELAQLTFIKLWQFRHTLSEELHFDGQLFQIATTCFIDYLRRENTQRKKTLLLSQNAALLATPADTGPATPFEESDYLHSLTRTLSPVRKKVFLLSRIQGHSYKEIAARLSISTKTVEDHMVKALRHLRSIASHLFIFILIQLLTVWLY
jgi:RNA polymerase sigma factor (sigma-70 family)